MHKNILSATGIILATTIFVVVNILANLTLTSWRFDLTDNKLFTFSQGTLNILEEIEEPIRLDFYFSKKAMLDYPHLINYGNRVRNMLLEYKSHANKMIELNIIDPEIFSEAEDHAVANGIQSVPLKNNSGERGYFGLAGTNSTDVTETIPFFHTNKEAALEYDITKLIHNLSYPNKRVVGIISTLPIYEDPEKSLPKWTILKKIEEFFTVRRLNQSIKNLAGIDILMLIHPKDLANETLFAIDQYLLNGGHAMIFLDPLSEIERTQLQDTDSGVLPDLDSNIKKLSDQWGINISENKVLGDMNAAMHVQVRTAQGPQQMLYLPWLRFAKESFNNNDFATSQINVLHMGSTGILEKTQDSDIQFTPLIESTIQSMQIERDFLLITQNPKVMLDNFKAENKKHVLAARVQGLVKTAFPNGYPAADSETRGQNSAENFIQEGEIHVVLVADTDMLSDIFWIRKQNFLGVEIPQEIANNGDFVVNTLENLSGNNDLVSLRTRKEYTRPFKKVEAIRREAELEYRESEKNLLQTLKETEQKILAIQQAQGQGQGSTLLLTSKQSEEIKQYQSLRIETRKNLRAVQHALNKNIASLGTTLRFFNIIFMPLLLTLIFIGILFYRMKRHK